MTVAMPTDHAGAFHVSVFGHGHNEPTRGTIDIKVTRTIEDPLDLRDLAFCQEFTKRFEGKGDGQLIHLSALGQRCRMLHARPFLLASRRLSPALDEYSWRGTNTDGMVEVVRADDGSERVLTRYTESLKVCTL
ncbi:unnamed protein product, partial [Sphacelaria rigidula]